MMQWIFILTGILASVTQVMAHGDDVAYLDFNRTPTSTTLTMALNPQQAFGLIPGSREGTSTLALLREKRDLISAYVQDHITILGLDRSGEFSACAWVADMEAHVPETELEVLADGITITGPLACLAAVPKHIEVTTDLFVIGTPEQENIIRTQHAEGFVDRVTLNRTTRTARVDLSVLDEPKNKTSPLVTFVLSAIFIGCMGLYYLTLPRKRV